MLILDSLFNGTAFAQPPYQSLRGGEGPRALKKTKNILIHSALSTVVHIDDITLRHV